MPDTGDTYKKNKSTGTIREPWREWTPKELELAKDPSISSEELAEVLGRSLPAVRMKRSRILRGETGVTRRRHRFTEEEDEFIKSHTISESSKFIGVSEQSIINRRQILASKDEIELHHPNEYTKEELEVLKDTSLPNRVCAEILGRSSYSISCKRYTMRKSGLIDDEGKSSGNFYSEDELEVLADPTMSDQECSEVLGRPILGIKSKRSMMRSEGLINSDSSRSYKNGKSSFTRIEDNLLLDPYTPIEEIASSLGVSVALAKERREKLLSESVCPISTNPRDFTAVELGIISNMSLDTKEVAIIIGREHNSVYVKRRNLGLL